MQALEQVQDAVLFVLQFSIEVLTDPDDSEAALIPDPIITMGKRHERRSDAEHSNECCQLVRSTLSYAECEDKYLEHAPHLVSPLVCAQQLTFLTRYVRSYLMPDVDEYGDFCTTYATSFQEGHELVELCLGKVLHCLRFMASEASVLTQAIALLRAIVVKRRIQTVLAASPKWRVFVEAVDHNDFGRLPSDCRRELFEVLCIGFGADHLHVLCRPLQQQFEGLMQQPGFVEKCQTEAVRQGVECCLEKLRGVSRAGLSGRAQAQRVFQFVTQTQILPTVVRLMDLYYTRHDVLILIIRCALPSAAEGAVLCGSAPSPRPHGWGGLPHHLHLGCPLGCTWPLARACALLRVHQTQHSVTGTVRGRPAPQTARRAPTFQGLAPSSPKTRARGGRSDGGERHLPRMACRANEHASRSGMGVQAPRSHNPQPPEALA